MRPWLLWLTGASCGWASAAKADAPSEFVVAGHKSTRPAREPSLSASRVDAQELGRPGATAAAILSHVPGVQISATGAGSDLSTASVRGATSAQTPVYLAGIRLNDDLTGSADLSLIPLWLLGRAEIYRSNAPADADRLGIGGAIFFEPRVPRQNRVLAGGGFGSFGERSGWLGAELATHEDSALVAFRAARADNDYSYLDDGGTVSPSDDRVRARPNADSSERDAWAIGRTSLGKHGARLTTVFNAFQREQGVSGLAALPALEARAEVARVLGGISVRAPCGSAHDCEMSLSTQLNSTRARLSDPRGELGLLEARLDSRATRIGQSARVSFGGPQFRALLGANLELERLALDGASALRASRSTSSGRLGLSAMLGAHTDLSALAMLSCDSTRGPEQSQACAASTPEGRVGLRQRFGAIEVRSNLGRYARVPTLGELYGVSAVVRGSSGLLPERGVAWDGGARAESQLGPVWAYLDAFAFARRVSDLIAYRRSSQGAVQPYNVGSARILGGELEAGAEWVRHARAALVLSYLDPRNTSSGRNLGNDLIPYQSRLTTGLLVEGFTEPWSDGPRLGLDARLSYQSSRLADSAGLLVLPASTALDLGVSAALARGAEWSVRGAIDDLFDARRFDFVGYPLPGRSLHVAVEARY